MIEYIHSHYDKQLTVTAIAKQAFTNKIDVPPYSINMPVHHLLNI